MLEFISKTQSFAIITHEFKHSEKEFLDYYIKSVGLQPVYWDPGHGNPVLHAGQILLANYSVPALRTWKEWSIPTSVIGHLNPHIVEEISSHHISSVWDLNLMTLASVLPFLGKKINSDPKSILIWTENPFFNQILKSLLPFFNMHPTLVPNPDFGLIAIKENDYDLIVLDWDYSGMEPLLLSRELRKIRSLKNKFPQIIGLKDFNKMNIFKDLSAGIREFCAVLFTYKEVVELLIRSAPIEPVKKQESYMDSELPFLSSHQEGVNRIYLEYKKENKVPNLKNQWTLNDLETLSFKKQFDWLSELKY